MLVVLVISLSLLLVRLILSLEEGVLLMFLLLLILIFNSIRVDGHMLRGRFFMLDEMSMLLSALTV